MVLKGADIWQAGERTRKRRADKEGEGGWVLRGCVGAEET